jgi:hypothetical protein
MIMKLIHSRKFVLTVLALIVVTVLTILKMIPVRDMAMYLTALVGVLTTGIAVEDAADKTKGIHPDQLKRENRLRPTDLNG